MNYFLLFEILASTYILFNLWFKPRLTEVVEIWSCFHCLDLWVKVWFINTTSPYKHSWSYVVVVASLLPNIGPGFLVHEKTKSPGCHVVAYISWMLQQTAVGVVTLSFFIGNFVIYRYQSLTTFTQIMLGKFLSKFLNNKT